MSGNNLYDVTKLDNEGTRWFYGKKTMNNLCAMNMYIDE